MGASIPWHWEVRAIKQAGDSKHSEVKCEIWRLLLLTDVEADSKVIKQQQQQQKSKI